MQYLAVKHGIFDLKMVPHAFFYMRNLDIIKSQFLAQIYGRP